MFLSCISIRSLRNERSLINLALKHLNIINWVLFGSMPLLQALIIIRRDFIATVHSTGNLLCRYPFVRIDTSDKVKQVQAYYGD